MTPVQLVIGFSSSFGTTPAEPLRVLFGNGIDAAAVLEKLHEATQNYHSRSNERERMVTFDHLTGRASVDCSIISVVSMDDAFGDNRDAVEAWTVAIGRLHAKGLAAGSDAGNDASAAGAGTAETAQQAQGEARQSGARSADAQPSPSPSNHGA